MKALDFYTEDIEIIEMPTGVVYKGIDKMRELSRMAYSRSGLHGGDISKGKSSTVPFVISVCYICHFTEEGKIDRVREYWDVATMTRQFGVESMKSKILRLLMRASYLAAHEELQCTRTGNKSHDDDAAVTNCMGSRKRSKGIASLV